MGIIISLLVVGADYSLASTARNAAYQINEKYGDYRDHLQFTGHWGFQYYMQAFGFKPSDLKVGVISQGDILAIPENNSGTKPIVEFLNHSEVQSLETIKLKPFSWLSSFHHNVGAGFYTAEWGPLPYAFGAVPDESYNIIQFQDLRNNNQK
jgi:hypothetical protein